MKMRERADILKQIGNQNAKQLPVSKLGTKVLSYKVVKKVVREFKEMGLIDCEKTKQGIFTNLTPLGVEISRGFSDEREEKLIKLVKELKRK